ncbi:hypothetical protein [Streptomyces sp. NPDC048202]|uniref:hypothetical protein n=1 Tax=Streptomyces sp. NPDC048202 TaxID=3365514 RepID=UPI0037184BA9
MTTTQVMETAAPAWHGGFGRLWSAAALSRFGDALRTAALPLLAVRLTAMIGLVAAAFRTAPTGGAPLGALLGGAAAGSLGLDAPALCTAALFALAVLTLIPARSADVSEDGKRAGVTTGPCPR